MANFRKVFVLLVAFVLLFGAVSAFAENYTVNVNYYDSDRTTPLTQADVDNGTICVYLEIQNASQENVGWNGKCFDPKNISPFPPEFSFERFRDLNASMYFGENIVYDSAVHTVSYVHLFASQEYLLSYNLVHSSNPPSDTIDGYKVGFGESSGPNETTIELYKSSYNVSVEFYNTDKETLHPYDGDDNALFIYVDIKDKSTGEIVGWNVQEFNPKQKTSTGNVCSFNDDGSVANCPFMKFGRISDDASKRNPDLNNNPITFDSDLYEIGRARLYSTRPNYHTVREELESGESRPNDTVEGTKFIGSTVGPNNTVMKLQKWNGSHLFIDVNFDPELSDAVTASDGYWLRAELTHTTGEPTCFVTQLVTDGTNPLHIEANEWRDNNGNVIQHEKFTGNEPNVTVQIYRARTGQTPNVTDLVKKNMDKIEEIAAGGTVKTYTVEYPDGTLTIKDRKTDDYENAVTNCIYNIYLNKQDDLDDALTPQDILGEAVEFGIVANKYIQHGHTETNYAVNYLYDADNTDLDGSGELGPIPFYVGRISDDPECKPAAEGVSKVWISEKTKIPADVFMNPEDIANGRYLITSPFPVNIYPMEEADINAYVNGLIQAGKNKSVEMASHTTMKPVFSGSGYTLDTTSYPDGTTIYVDADGILEAIQQGGWHINKLPNQSIVFNINALSNAQITDDITNQPVDVIKIGKFDVNPNDPRITEPVESTTSALNGDPALNQRVDEVILSHITFNVVNAPRVHLDNASALFLLPEAERVTQSNGAGWILTKGTIDSHAEWHFYRHARSYQAKGDFTLESQKKLVDGYNSELPFENKNFKFEMYTSDETGSVQGTLVETALANGTTGLINFHSVKYTDSEVPVSETREFYYLIKEVIPASAVNSEGVRYDEATEQQKASGIFTKDSIVYNAAPILVKVTATNTPDDPDSPTSGVITIAVEVNGTAVTGTQEEHPVYKLQDIQKTFTNTKSVSISARKTWRNSDNSPLAAPTTATFTLYRKIGNGDLTATTHTVTLDGTADAIPTGTGILGYESAPWTASFIQLPGVDTASGNTITYKIGETVPEGFTASPTDPVEDGQTIINTAEKIEVNARKAWLNDDNTTTPPAGASVKFTLYANDEATEFSVTLDGSVDDIPTGGGIVGYESPAWNAKFANLPQFDKNGDPVTYTVVETTKYPGYKAVPSDTVSDGETITNTNGVSGTATIGVLKAIANGSAWPEGVDTVTFTITSSNGGTLPDPATLSFDKSEVNVEKFFENIVFGRSDVAKVYKYQIEETSGFGTAGSNDGPINVTISVGLDDGSGTLHPTVSYENNKKTITNTYTATGSIILGVSKTMENDYWPTGTTTFPFTMEGDKITGTLTENAAQNAPAVFTGITFDLTDVAATQTTPYTYTIRENCPADYAAKGVTCSTEPVVVTVTLKDNGDGTISPDAVEVNGQAVPPETLSGNTVYVAGPVVNSYAATGDVTFEGTKSIDKRSLTAQDIFTFEVTENGTTNKWDVTSDSTGKIDYPKIEYTLDDLGTHTYTVKETSTDGNGITVATNTYSVTVNVTDNGDGTLNVVPSTNYNALDFENKYTATGSTTFEGTKSIDRRSLTAQDVFTFEISENGTTKTWNASSDSTGKITYPTINYTVDDLGLHTYTVKETSTDGNGITVATNTYTVTVDVTDNGDGTLNVVPSNNYNALDFENKYAATGSVTFEGTKTIDKRSLTAQDVFTFEISENGTTKTWSGSSDSTGKITYTTIQYTLDDVGSHTYTVKETSTNGRGITVDTNTYTVTVEVTDKGDGTLNVVPSVNYNALNFENKYAATGSVTFGGTKSIDKRALTAQDVFTFEISENETSKKWNASSDATGKITYPTIEYTLEDVGSHTYTVKETSTDGNGITVATNTYTVTVDVSDKGDGTLNVVPSNNYNALNFENKYAATGSVTFGGTKSIDKRSMTAQDIFTFEVKEDGTENKWTVSNDATGKINYPKIDYTLADVGSHTYTVKETSTNGNGITVSTNTYTVTVQVSDKGDGTLNVVPDSNYNALDFENKYAATGNVTFEGTKSIDKRSMTAQDIFTFEVTENGTENKWTVSNDATGKINYPTIEYTLADVGSHTYTVKETSTDGNGITVSTNTYTVTVQVSDNGNGTLKVEPSVNYKALNFENKYAASGKVKLAVTKEMANWPAGTSFSFELNDNGNGKIPGEKEVKSTSSAGAPAEFSEIEFTLDDVRNAPFSFTISELPSTNPDILSLTDPITVKVDLADNGDGTLGTTVSVGANTINPIGGVFYVGKFTNALVEKGAVNLAITKSINVWPKDGEFTFALNDNGNGKIPGGKDEKTAASGSETARFEPIRFGLADLTNQPFTFTITENDPGITGVSKLTNDPIEVVINLTNVNNEIVPTVKVGGKTIDPVNGVIYVGNFENKYEASGSVTFEGNKSIDTRAIKTGEVFTFEITETGTENKWSVSSDSTGKINYPTINYTQDNIGLHTYTVKETSVDGNGITVATNSYTVTVQVSDNGNGTLKVEPSSDFKALDFENKYTATGSVTFGGTKSIDKRSMTAQDIFTFEVTENGTENKWTVSNDATGKINYPTIEYTLADLGSHSYTVKETSTDGNGITVATNTYTVTVQVSDNGDGTLNVVPGSNYNALNFENKYAASGSVTFGGTKSIDKRSLTEQDKFTFEIAENGTSKKWTASSDATGKINYPAIEYTLEDVGSHTYTVRETSVNGNGITVATNTYTVTVQVSDNGDGTLNVVPDSSYNALNFENQYAASGNVTFGGAKSIDKRALTAQDVFTFEVSENGTESKWTVSNDSTGKINYPTIEYTLADVGTHTYTVKETSTDGNGITVATNTYTVMVRVTDNGDGTLNVEPGSNYNALNFENKYAATGNVTFGGTKSIDKRALTAQDVFTFEITENGTENKWSAVSDATGKISYPTIEYTLEDVGTHTYTVKETSLDGNGITVATNTYTVTVQVSDNGDGTLNVVPGSNFNALNFENKYAATGNVTFGGTKSIDKRFLTESDVFTFEITENETSKKWSASSDATGKINYPTIEYTLDDVGTHTYTVKETSSDGNGINVAANTYTVTVIVSDNGDGTLKVEPSDNYQALNFENKYAATGSVTFGGTKSIDKRAMTEQDVFTFEISENGTAKTWNASSDAAGKISYPTIEYTLADVGTHTYTVKETSESGNGITVATNTYTVTVKVTDNGDGTLNVVPSDNYQALNFENKYAATGSVTFEGNKSIDNRALTSADVFTFEIAENGTSKTWSASSDSTGKINYPTIEYTLDDVGSHTYTVRETSADRNGITVSTNTYTVTVQVSDNGDGTLNVVPGNNYNALNFENKYAATGKVKLAVTKAMANWPSGTSFSFELNDNGGWKIPGGKEVKSTSSAGTPAEFSEIEFTLDDAANAPFFFTISELPSANPDILSLTDPITVEVDLADNGDGTLRTAVSVGENAINPVNGVFYVGEFENETIEKGAVILAITKSINVWPEGAEFTFVLDDNGNGKIAGGKDEKTATSGSATARFEPIRFGLADMTNQPFNFTITEKDPGINGVSKLTTGPIAVTVSLTMVGDEVIPEVKVNGKTTDPVNGVVYVGDFENKYEASGTVTFEGNKSIDSRDLKSGEVYTFEITENGTENKWTVSSDSTGKINYPTISYTQDNIGLHTYTVKETSTDGKGVTVATNTYTVTVQVSDNGNGTLNVVPSSGYNALDFENKYAASGSVTFAGTKSIDKRALTAADIFTFEVTESGTTNSWSVTSDANGKINYPTIEYTLEDVGPHTYTVKETSMGGNGITAASTTYIVTVQVSDNGDGTLNVMPGSNYNALDFVNKYATAGDVTFGGTKSIDKRSLTEADVFTFEITEDGTANKWTASSDATGKISYPTIEYTMDDAGTHTYTVRETSTDGNGITVASNTYKVTVKVSDNGDGTLKVEPSDNYKALDFVNAYAAEGEITFEGKKSIDNRALTAADVFTFEIAENGTSKTWNAASDSTGKISYPTIEYTLEDVGTHTYTVKETSADGNGITVAANTYTVTVRVTDNGDGTLNVVPSDNCKALDFVNAYTAEGEITFAGTKSIDKRALTDADVFSFEITENGTSKKWGAGNDATGKINYPVIKYTLEDVGLHTYTVRETSMDGNGITVATNTYTVTVQVSDNGDGTLNVVPSSNYKTLDFVNKYGVSGSITFEGTKSIDNRALTADDVFTFEITEDGTAKKWTASNDSNGKINYPTIEYTLEDVGSHTYTVRETSVDRDGITVATNTYTVTVRVSDNGDGTLKVEASDNYKALDFVNTYSDSGEAEIKVRKDLAGRAWDTADSFTFTIEKVGEAPMPAKSSVTITKNTPNFTDSFGTIPFTAPGTYRYIVKETKGSVDGITYDETEHPVTITVVDDGHGNLVADAGSQLVQTVTITNTYSASGTSIVLSGTKTLRDYPAGYTVPTFTYTLSENGSVIDTATTTGAGNYAFKPIFYTEVGDHTYTITETQGTQPAIRYDTKVYTVKVSVVDDGTGKLNATVTEGSPTGLDFTNYYTEEGTMALAVTKEFNAWPNMAQTFTFRLIGDDAVSKAKAGGDTGVIATAAADNGTAFFHTMMFTEEDMEFSSVYKFTISEVIPAGAINNKLNGIQYSDKEIKVTVNLASDGQGHIIPTVTADGETIDPNGNVFTVGTFINAYQAETKLKLKASKHIVDSDQDTAESHQIPFEIWYKEDHTKFMNGDPDVKPFVWHDVVIYDNGITPFDFMIRYTVEELPEPADPENPQPGENGYIDENGYTVTSLPIMEKAGKARSVVNPDKTITWMVDYILDEKTVVDQQLKPPDQTFEVVVTIVDNSNGELSITQITEDNINDPTDTPKVIVVTDSEPEIVVGEFVNKERKDAEPITISGGKTMQSRALTDADNGKWKAVMSVEPAEGPLPESPEVPIRITNGAGSYEFGPIRFTAVHLGECRESAAEKYTCDPKVYTYTITEVGSVDGVINDSAKTFKVRARLNNEGDVMAEFVDPQDISALTSRLTFTNTYSADVVSAQFGGKKTITGQPAGQTSSVFTYNLMDMTGTVLQTKTTTGAGYYQFDPITYTAAGDYNYTVSETVNVGDGVIYDRNVYSIKVVVTDDGSGYLKKKVTVTDSSGNTVPEDGLDFTNRYVSGAYIQFHGTKTIIGEELEGAKFRFELLDDEGNVLQTVLNDGGNITFDVIAFTKPGTYTYTIREIAGTRETVTYDTRVYNVTVVVEKDAEGNLYIAATRGDDPHALDFINEYHEEFHRVTPVAPTLPKTGFSALHPQSLPQQPKDINYRRLNWRLEIPSLDVSSDIVIVPSAGGEYPVTWLGHDTGLLEGYALPGYGSAVITGHNHLNTTEAGPFALLYWMQEGDRIFVTDPLSNMQIFEVYANEKISETDFAGLNRIASKYDNSLTMITCEDERPGGGYDNRRIIAAKPLDLGSLNLP